MKNKDVVVITFMTDKILFVMDRTLSYVKIR